MRQKLKKWMSPGVHCVLAVVVYLTGALLMHSAFAQTSFGTDASVPPQQEVDLAALLSSIKAESKDNRIRYNGDGKPVAIELGEKYADEANITLVAQCQSLQDLFIKGDGRFARRPWTASAMSSLAHCTNLTSLSLRCVGAMPSGSLREISKLRGLRFLELASSFPEAHEYFYLTNLQNLAELRIVFCPNFTDAHLAVLTNLGSLQRLTINADGLSLTATNILAHSRGLTNISTELH